jgi:hypothetical protein
VHRDMPDTIAPPQFVSLLGYEGLIDRWHTTYYTPPGFCSIAVGATPAGSNDESRGFKAWVLNLITPETRNSSHYFWAHARDVRRDDAQLTKVIQHSLVETFNQDKVILEAQQIQAEAVGSRDPGIILGIDAGAMQGRRVLAAAIKANES